MRRTLSKYISVIIVVAVVMISTQAYYLMSRIVKKHMHFLLQLTPQARGEKLCDKDQLYNEKSTASGRGFRNFTLPNLLNNFRNPCFFKKTSITSNNINTDVDLDQLRCMPYFFIAGFPKAGTSDLWYRLKQHPDVLAKHQKEPWIIHKRRHSYSTFEEAANSYVEFFKSTALAIGTMHEHSQTDNIITGEGSCDTAHYNFKWQEWPGNENCTEPVITNADYVHQINPKMKIIFMIRDPADRLYSDYIYEAGFYRYNTSVEDFHRSAINAIESFQRCATQHSVRSCAYNTSLDTQKIRIRLGMYHIFIENWLKVFGPQNTIIVHTENTLGQKRLDTYRTIIKFLELRPLTRDEEDIMLQGNLLNTRSKKGNEVGDMLNVTRKTLDDFYAPFIKQMSTFKSY